MNYQTSLRKGGKHYDQTRIHKKTIKKKMQLEYDKVKACQASNNKEKAGKTQESRLRQGKVRKSKKAKTIMIIKKQKYRKSKSKHERNQTKGKEKQRKVSKQQSSRRNEIPNKPEKGRQTLRSNKDTQENP